MKSINKIDFSFLNVYRQFVAFLIVGAINTIVGYGIYYAILYFSYYQIAYTMTFIIGIFISYFLNSLFVFKEPVNFKTLVKYPIVYIVQYLLGISSMFVLVELFVVDAKIAPLIVIALTIPITFFLTRTILKGKGTIL